MASVAKCERWGRGLDFNCTNTVQKLQSQQQIHHHHPHIKEEAQPQSATSKYVVKPTNKNVKAYMQFKEQAKAIWNANQEKVAGSSLGPSDLQQQQ